MVFQHLYDNQTSRLQAGPAEDDYIYLPSRPDRVVCDRQEEPPLFKPREGEAGRMEE